MPAPRGDSNYPTAYRIGCGRRAELPAACRELGLARPLVVTDGGLRDLPWFSALVHDLRREGLDPVVFSDVSPNPGEADVAAGLAAYRDGARDGLVLVGGGSALDVGKCVALMVGNAGPVFDYEDVGDNWKRVDPAGVARKIALPTTAGTGSEVGRASVLVDVRDHAKKIVFHPRMQPELVIADPELTFGLPPHLTAATGMDALAHCFEAFCAPGFHPMADGIALEGMRLIRGALPRAFGEPHDAEARTHMLMAAAMGATAFQKGLGLVHALSHPLGGATGIHHGLCNAIFLPYCMEFNRAAIEDRMVILARHLDLPAPGFRGVLDWMLALRRDLGLPHTLAGFPGVNEASLRRLAPLAALDPSLATNPVPATIDQLEAVFVRALKGELTA
jgi:hypothetical protein